MPVQYDVVIGEKKLRFRQVRQHEASVEKKCNSPNSIASKSAESQPARHPSTGHAAARRLILGVSSQEGKHQDIHCTCPPMLTCTFNLACTVEQVLMTFRPRPHPLDGTCPNRRTPSSRKVSAQISALSLFGPHIKSHWSTQLTANKHMGSHSPTQTNGNNILLFADS